MNLVKAIILAAGKGTRLRPLTDNMHKCFTEINSKPILIRLLDQLASVSIEEVSIIVGYLADSIIKKVGDNYAGMKINYILNEDFDKTNNIVSLQKAKKVLNDNTLLLECDIVLEENILTDLLIDNHADIMVIDNYKKGMEGTVVSVGKDGIITDMILKKEQTPEMDLIKFYKTVNVYKFSKYTSSMLASMLDDYINENGGNDYYEIVIKKMVKENISTFKALLTDKRKWIEIDNESDLKTAQFLFQE